VEFSATLNRFFAVVTVVLHIIIMSEEESTPKLVESPCALQLRKEPQQNFSLMLHSQQGSVASLAVEEALTPWMTKADSKKKLPLLKDPEEEAELLNSYVVVSYPNEYQKIESMTDSFPFLNLRKGLLRLKTCFSETCELIISSSVFEWFIILVILLNIVVLALEDPNEQNKGFDRFFLYVYSVEAVLKIGGLGFVLKKGTYLRDYWNIVDFVIVITGWAGIFFEGTVNLTALRTLRLLRPLRSISSIKGLRVLFMAILGSTLPLLVFLVFFMFFLLIFAIAGTHLWMGSFKYQCMEIETGQIIEGDVCGYYECQESQVCAKGITNPNWGVTNFDNVLYSFLTVFQCVTLEGWTDIMEDAQKALSYWVALFFLPLVFIGAFLLLNLILAVVKFEFTEAMIFVNKEDNSQTVSYNELTEKTDKSFGSANKEKEFFKILSEIQSPEPKFAVERFVFTEQVDRLSDKEQEQSPRTARVIPRIPLTTTFRDPCSRNFHGSIIFEEVQQEDSNNEIHSLQVKEQLVKKLKSSNQPHHYIARIKEDLQVPDESSSDVLPKISVFEKIQKFPKSESDYVFSFKGADLDKTDQDEVEEVEQEYLEKISSTLAKHPHTQKRSQVFAKLAKRFKKNEAFFSVAGSAHCIVKSILEKDRITQSVRGYWSGFQVSEETGRQAKLRTNLSKMSYRLWKQGLMGFVQKLRHPAYIFVSSNFFGFFMILCVFLNTTVLAIDHHGASEEFDNVLYTLNLTFTIIFICEMGLKILGMGIEGYLRDSMNYFDALIVIVSIIELVFLAGTTTTTAFRTVRIFRTIRVVRVGRLLRYMQSLSRILNAISESISKFIFLAILLLLFILVFALLGMQIFGGKFDFPEGKPRGNFDSFHWAFVTVFQVLSMENWPDLLYNAMRSEAGKSSCIFFIVWIFLGNFVLLNLFLAILLDSFNMTDTDVEEAMESNQEDSDDEEKNSIKKKSSILGNYLEKSKMRKQEKLKKLENISESESSEMEISAQEIKLKKEKPKLVYGDIKCEKSFGVFSKESTLRIACYKVFSSKNFDTVIFLVIALSSLKLVWDTYLINEPKDSAVAVTSVYLDYFFTGIFVLEFLVKSISLGFVRDKGSYLKDNWNKLDFFIVVFSLVDIGLGSDYSMIKVFRLFRAIRPLRFISQNASMRIVVKALLESIVALFNVAIVLLMIWLIFAILGVSLFGGKFYTCENPEVETKELCETLGYTWQNADSNFDNVLEAMLTLFIVSSLEGWPSIMHQGVDAYKVDYSPRKNQNPAAAYFFILFILVGSFFFLNLFIGVVFEQFNRTKMEESSIAVFLAKEQRRWLEMQSLIPNSVPQLVISKEPKNKVRLLLYKVSNSNYFEVFILLCIIANMIQMALAYDGAPDSYINTLETINVAFTYVFIVEALIKIIGLGPYSYFHNGWNRFDFFVVVLSILDLVLTYSPTSNLVILRKGPQLLKIIKVIRVSRIIRAFKVIRSLEEIVILAKHSLPAILNVFGLLLLIFFIYAVLGSFLYHDVEYGQNINSFTNFENFGMAMLALFRISTGENWHLMMFQTIKSEGNYTPVIYYISFIVITSFVMLNLFIMIFIQSYEDFKLNPESSTSIFNRELKKFKKAWIKFTGVSGGLRIYYMNLINFMYELGPELGVSENTDHDKVVKLLSTMDLQIQQDGFVYYNDMLFAIMKRKHFMRLKSTNSKNLMNFIRKEEKKTLIKLYKLRDKAKMNFQTLQRVRVT